MDSVRDFAVMISVSSVSVSFLTFLVPDGVLKKTVGSVVTLFFMCIFVVPIFSEGYCVPDVSFSVDDFPDESDFFEAADEFYIKSGKSVVSSQIDEILENICVGEYSIDVKMTSDNNGNIVLAKIKIDITQEDSVRIAKIITSVGCLTGIKPDVEVK